MAIQCAYCEKSIGRYDDYIVCRSDCERNYHLKCVGISIAQYNQIREDGTIKEWKCNDCSVKLTSIINDEKKEVSDNSSLEKFINEKIENAIKSITNTIITSLQIEIEKLRKDNRDLQREVAKLKINSETKFSVMPEINREKETGNFNNIEMRSERNNNSQTGTISKHRKNSESEKKTTADDKKIENKNINKNSKEENSLKEIFSKKSLLEKKVHKNKKNDENSGKFIDDDGFELAIARKNKRRNQNTITGTAQGTNLKGVKQYRHFHLYRLSPETTTKDIIDYLKTQNIDAKCEKLVSKYPDEYSSFKLSVEESHQIAIENTQLWPAGARINRFLFRLQASTLTKT